MTRPTVILVLFGILLGSQCDGFPASGDDNTVGQEDVATNDNDLDFNMRAIESGRSVAEWTQYRRVNADELELYEDSDITSPVPRNGIVGERYRWRNETVPYVITGDFNEQDRATIQAAFDAYHTRTCLNFVPRDEEVHNDYIDIQNAATGCHSALGRRGGPQILNLQSPGCLTTLGTPIHELMHAVGFLHEQNRRERDEFVTIMWENIIPGYEGNFFRAEEGQESGQGVPYDYGSVMHYSAFAFSRNQQPTIVPTDPNAAIGQRDGFSDGDVLKIRRMYRCPQEQY